MSDISAPATAQNPEEQNNFKLADEPTESENAENGVSGSAVAGEQQATNKDPTVKYATAKQRVAKRSSFPLLNMPSELQIAVFIEAVPKPAVHFFNAKIVWHDNKTRWSMKFLPVPKSSDDSLYRYSSELAKLCPSAEKAMRCIGGGSPKFQVGMRQYHIDIETDILCLHTPGLFQYPAVKDKANTRRLGIYWHPDSQHRDPKINFDAVRAAMRGYERVAVYCNGRDTGTAPFTCNDPTSDSHEFGICPAQLAGFIDCCPDIKHFYIILGTGHGSRPGSQRSVRIQQWFGSSTYTYSPSGLSFTYAGASWTLNSNTVVSDRSREKRSG
jgi:hypothetical protein